MTVVYTPEQGLFIGEPGKWEEPVDPCIVPRGSLITAGLGVSRVLPSLDFETYSEAGYDLDHATGKVRGTGPQGKGGLPVVGTPVYAEHPTAEILCLYYDLKDGKGRRAWVPGAPNPTDLLQYIASGGEVEAWNITFEFWVWNLIGVCQYGWPVLQLEQCHCAMAKARHHSLPGSLGKAAIVLGTPEKDKEGGRLVQKLTRPHTTTKNRPAFRWTPITAWDDFKAFYRYCDRDVETEDHASAHIPDLSDQERKIWLADQTVNTRGVQVDMPSLRAMLAILDQTERKYNAELSTLTGGVVTAASQLAKLGAWLNGRGLVMPNMQESTITDTLDRFKKSDPELAHVPEDARRCLEIRSLLGSANVKKFRTLDRQVSSDGRLRDQYMYCGAAQTDRWSAGGVQLQNMTAKGPKSSECEACGEFFGQHHESACPHCGAWMLHTCPEWTVEAVVSALKIIATHNLATVELFWGDPLALLCGCLRGVFMAAPGHDFICVDFSAIEAVVAACLSRCQWRIDIFGGHGKIYEASAAKATGIPLEEILQYKIDTGMSHPARKTIGKVRELAGGYGGWIGAWKNFGAGEFMTDEEIKTDILAWREESSEIVYMWGGQFLWCGPGKWDYRPELHGLEGMAINAIRTPGTCFSYLDITYGVWDDVLYCRLPSGRFLKYHRPRLTPVKDKMNRGPAVQITFEGYNTNSQKGAVGWVRMETYGGRLFENVVQAVARDFQADALVRVEQRGYPVVMHTHDELTAEVPEGSGTLEEMTDIMTELPTWAAGWPIRATGWRHQRYQKD